MVKTPCCDKSRGLKKGTWTPEEDRKLIGYVTRYGHWNWRLLPKFAGLARCGKSCRLRWTNYLRPDIKRGTYTPEEDDTIIKLHAKLGNRWSMIAAHLPGRSDNAIKNHWHTNLKKRVRHSSVTNEKAEAPKSKDHDTSVEPTKEKDSVEITGTLHNNTQTPDVNSPLSQHTSLSDFFCTIAEPEASDHRNSVLGDDFVNFLNSYNTEPISADFWTELTMADISYFPGEFLAPFQTQSECSSPFCDAQLWSQSE